MADPRTLSFQSPSQTSGMDGLDLDRFLNLDHLLSPQSESSSTAHKTAPNPTLMPTQAQVNQDYLSLQPSPQVWARPSHQYGLHKQQAGLPVGALANTVGTSSSSQYSYGQGSDYDLFSTGDSSFGVNTTNDFELNVTPPQVSASVHSDMDYDFTSASNDAFMFEGESNADTFVDPSAIDRQAEKSNQRLRVYPGIHSQQAQKAAEAKAQAEAQRKTQQIQARQAVTRANGKVVDPIVEESITRVLNQMRNNSVVSANDSTASPPASGPQHSSRTKKEEEDMDEDERLLASEEGKKLSSKERRQLRNKVSARAFRSRRKEYIGQLEGEIAQKAQEADDLRIKNEELMAENKRLNDLTRMLLSSSSFSSFLSEISQPSSTASNSAPGTEEPVKLESRDTGSSRITSEKSPNQHHVNAQVGMTFVPEPQLNYRSFGNQADSWVDENDTSLYDAQIFAVTSIPEGPSMNELNISALSGKPSKESMYFPAPSRQKSQFPEIERMPTSWADGAKISDSSDYHSNDSASLDLYSSDSCTSTGSSKERTESSQTTNEKPSNFIKLYTRSSSISEACMDAATMEKYEQLCSVLDQLGESIDLATSRR